MPLIEALPITDRREWLTWRSLDITASDIGSLFGLGWKSPLQLWAEKTGQVQSVHDTPLMRRGRWLEPAVLEALREAYPRDRIERCNVYLRDPALRLGATPDAMLGHRLVECKVVSRPVYEAWPDGIPPIAYQLQASTGAMLMDAPAAIIAMLVIDTYSAELVTFHVERNEQAEISIRARVAQFWADTALGIRPPADYGDDGALIARLYRPREELPALDLSSDNRLPEILAEREGLNDQIKANKARCDAIQAEIVEKLNGAPAAVCGPWTLRHKFIHVGERLQQAYEYQRLTVSKKREE